MFYVGLVDIPERKLPVTRRKGTRKKGEVTVVGDRYVNNRPTHPLSPADHTEGVDLEFVTRRRDKESTSTNCVPMSDS